MSRGRGKGRDQFGRRRCFYMGEMGVRRSQMLRDVEALTRRLEASPLLLRYALDGEGAKYRVLFTNSPDFVVIRPFAPRRNLLGAIPNLDHYSLRRMSFERNYVKTCSKNSAARFQDARLGSWGILVGIAAKFTDSNFSYNVD